MKNHLRFCSRSRATAGLTMCALLLTQGCMGYHTVKSARAEATDEPAGEPELVCDKVIDDFSGVAPGEFPAGWQTPVGSDLELAKKSGNFRVEELDGRRVLRARYQKGAAFTLGRGVDDWDLGSHPIVTWQWKVTRLPKREAEVDQDVAASVQAVWLVGLPFFVRTLRYTWSAGQRVGTRAEARLGHDQLVVLRSGKAVDGGFRTERIDLREQYRTLFGQSDEKAPAGISIQTGVDDSDAETEAYYARFRLCRAPGAPATVATPSENAAP